MHFVYPGTFVSPQDRQGRGGLVGEHQGCGEGPTFAVIDVLIPQVLFPENPIEIRAARVLSNGSNPLARYNQPVIPLCRCRSCEKQQNGDVQPCLHYKFTST